MDDFRLKVFRSVATHLSFTKASQELFITQPAISKHIRELETTYQVCLFDRMGGKIALTDAGVLLLDHCNKILHAYEELEYDMHLLCNKYSGTLRLGASTTLSQYVLPPLLGRFARKFSDISLSLHNGNSRDVEEELLQHHIDLGLVEGLSKNPSLKYTPFMKDELVAVVHIHNKKVPEEVSIDTLKKIPLVLREQGSGTLEVIEKVFAEHNISLSALNVMMYLGSTESIKLFLENSDCMGIVSIRSIAKELAEGKFRIVDIEGVTMCRDFCFVQVQGDEKSISRLFIDFTRRELEVHL